LYLCPLVQTELFSKNARLYKIYSLGEKRDLGGVVVEKRERDWGGNIVERRGKDRGNRFEGK